MLIFRKLVVFLLSVLLYIVIVGAATATSITLVFSQPTKLENMLAQSKLYDNLVSNVLEQVNTSQANSTGGIATTDQAVQTAAEEAFNPTELQKDVNIVIDANYAWLQGKTDKPVFTIDLSSAKQTFATNVGSSVTTYLAELPVCTNTELVSINYAEADPLTVTCRPASIDPTTAGANVTAELLSSDSFMKQTTFTADDLGQNGSTPYYQKASFAPTVYHYATFAPYVGLGLIILLSVLILFIAPRKRNGVRSLAIVYLISGIVLVSGKFAADYAVKHINISHINFLGNNSNSNTVGPLEESVNNFVVRVVHAVTINYAYIGAFLIVLSLIGFACLLFTRKRRKPRRETAPQPSEHTMSNQQAQPTQQSMRPASQTPQIRTAPRLASTPSARPAPQKPKRPRLIQ
jgi:hypothetical protein